MYEYKCKVIEVIDGNTVDANIDLGFNVTIRQRIKLYGVHAPNPISNNETERENALLAKVKLAEIIGKEFICQTLMNKRGKAGRILGNAYTLDINGNRIDVNKAMIDSGLTSQFGE
jgi:micrococcal nuclease